MDKTVFPSGIEFPELNTKHFALQLKSLSEDLKAVFSEQKEQYHYVDENSVLKDVFVDVNYIKQQVDTLTNEELESVINHCKMLIEKNTDGNNTDELGGV